MRVRRCEDERNPQALDEFGVPEAPALRLPGLHVKPHVVVVVEVSRRVRHFDTRMIAAASLDPMYRWRSMAPDGARTALIG